MSTIPPNSILSFSSPRPCDSPHHQVRLAEVAFTRLVKTPVKTQMKTHDRITSQYTTHTTSQHFSPSSSSSLSHSSVAHAPQFVDQYRVDRVVESKLVEVREALGPNGTPRIEQVRDVGRIKNSRLLSEPVTYLPPQHQFLRQIDLDTNRIPEAIKGKDIEKEIRKLEEEKNRMMTSSPSYPATKQFGLELSFPSVSIVAPTSLAGLCGFQAQDAIMAVNGNDIKDAAELERAIKSCNSSMGFKIKRQGKVMFLQWTR